MEMIVNEKAALANTISGAYKSKLFSILPSSSEPNARYEKTPATSYIIKQKELDQSSTFIKLEMTGFAISM